MNGTEDAIDDASTVLATGEAKGANCQSSPKSSDSTTLSSDSNRESLPLKKSSNRTVFTEEEKVALTKVVMEQPEFPKIRGIGLSFWHRVHTQFHNTTSASNSWSPQQLRSCWRHRLRYLERRQELCKAGPSTTLTRYNLPGASSSKCISSNSSQSTKKRAKKGTASGCHDKIAKEVQKTSFECSTGLETNNKHTLNEDERDTLFKIVMAQPEFPHVFSRGELWKRIHEQFTHSIDSTRAWTPNQLRACWTSRNRPVVKKKQLNINSSEQKVKNSQGDSVGGQKSAHSQLTSESGGQIKESKVAVSRKVSRCRPLDHSYTKLDKSPSDLTDVSLVPATLAPKKHKKHANEARSESPCQTVQLEACKATKHGESTCHPLDSSNKQEKIGHKSDVAYWTEVKDFENRIESNSSFKESSDDRSTSSDEDIRNYSALSPDVEWDREDEEEESEEEEENGPTTPSSIYGREMSADETDRFISDDSVLSPHTIKSCDEREESKSKPLSRISHGQKEIKALTPNTSFQNEMLFTEKFNKALLVLQEQGQFFETFYLDEMATLKDKIEMMKSHLDMADEKVKSIEEKSHQIQRKQDSQLESKDESTHSKFISMHSTAESSGQVKSSNFIIEEQKSEIEIIASAMNLLSDQLKTTQERQILIQGRMNKFKELQNYWKSQFHFDPETIDQ